MRHARNPRRVSEMRKRPGLSYVFTEGGLELPVIDLGHPAFALSPTDAELELLVGRTVRDIERREKMPPLPQKLMLRLLLRGSLLAGIVGGARGGYVSGMGTYLLKLGPDMLGLGYAKKIDRAIAASLPCLSARLRLRDTARLLAEALRESLVRKKMGTLRLFNLAGGPASDSLNALISLRRQTPGSLEGRKIEIAILDVDEEGPAFGARSADALLVEGAPLAGLDLKMRRLPYDWNNSVELAAMLSDIDAERDVVAISSEGGLFEYASDEVMAANLRAFASSVPEDAIFVGSISKAEGSAGRINRASGAAVRPRSLQEFGGVAAKGLWRIERTAENPLGLCLALRPKSNS
jgi:hypothetical protein